MKYIINDLEGGNFGDWSHDDPVTLQELIAHFKTLSDDDDLKGGDEDLIPIESFSIPMIQEIWHVEILPVLEA